MTYLRPVLPLLLFVTLLGLAFARSRRWRIAGIIAAVSLYLWAWPPFTRLLAFTLERPYPILRLPSRDIQAIVVLASDVGGIDRSTAQPLLSFDTRLRSQHAAWIYRQGRRVPVVASGGVVSGVIVSTLMRDDIAASGVPADMILAEQRSRNTYENAAFVAELLRPRGLLHIALVTEAYHMRRAEACFRKQGFLVEPAPSSFRTEAVGRSWQDLVPGGQAIRYNDDTLHEWLGLIWYWLLGRI